MKKFSDIITEAQGNVYQVGTPFSNGHRSRKNRDGFLFDRHLMIDIDQIILNPDGSIWAIVENKKQLPGPNSQLKNILTGQTFQKMALMELTKLLGCHLFVYVELDKKYYLIKNSTQTIDYSEMKFNETKSNRNYQTVDSDNKIFIEFRIETDIVTFKSIDVRISDSDVIVKNIAKKISQSIKTIYVEIDDSGDYINFYINGHLIGNVLSVLEPKKVDMNLRTNLEDTWSDIYQKIGIF